MPLPLAFKSHFRAHVLSETEVALLGEAGRFALRGRAYALIAPLLDGTRTDEEIAASLADEIAPEMVYYALERLRARGYVIEGAVQRRDAWWFAQDQAPAARNGALARSRVAVSTIGIDDRAAEDLAAKLAVSLHMADGAETATLEVCLVDDYLRPELAEVLRRAREQGRSVLPVRPSGIEIWLGPFCRPDETPDWAAFLARLKDNRPSDVTVLTRGAGFPILPDVQTPETLDLALSLAASTAIRCAAGAPPDFIDGSIHTVDTGTLETRTHALPRPAPPPADEAEDVPVRKVDLRPSPKKYTVDGGHRVCEPEETLARLTALVSPISGIVPDIQKAPTPGGIHVFVSTQVFHLEDGGKGNKRRSRHQENRMLGRPSGAAGKGQTEVQARVSCLAEAVERYSCGFFGDEPRRCARLDDLGEAGVHPAAILNFSDRQYRERQAFNEGREDGRTLNWVPAPFDPDRPVDWTPVWSLSHRRVRWVPTALCYFTYASRPEMEGPVFARACSNGCASGNTIEEAILQGLLELIERDACALWWYNRVRRPGIDLTSFHQPFFDAMVTKHAEQGRTLRVLDLTTDLGVPVALAVSWRDDDGGDIDLGLGCHTEPRMAVSRAISEINQSFGFGIETSRHDETGLDRDHVRWIHEATIDNQPYVLPLDGPAVTAADMRDRSSPDIATDVRTCIDRLSDLGYETLVLDHTRADVGFPTARVIVPGLRHFWARLGPGRLYDVPVSLGWLDRPLDESELNPVPFFL